MARVLPWSKEVSTPLPPQRRSSMKSDDPPSIALPVHTSNAHSNSATTPQSKDSSPVTKTIPNIPPPLPPPRATSPAVLELPSAQSTVYEVNDKDVQLSPMSKRAPFPSPSKFPPKGNKNGSGESPTLWTPSEANHDDDDIIPPLPEKMSKTITSPSTNTNSFEDDPDIYDTIRKPSTISQWLMDLGLPQYIHGLVENGWDSIAYIDDITDKDLCEANVQNASHRQKILLSIRNMAD